MSSKIRQCRPSKVSSAKSDSTGCGCRRGVPKRSPRQAANSCAPSASTFNHYASHVLARGRHFFSCGRDEKSFRPHPYLQPRTMTRRVIPCFRTKPTYCKDVERWDGSKTDSRLGSLARDLALPGALEGQEGPASSSRAGRQTNFHVHRADVATAYGWFSIKAVEELPWKGSERAAARFVLAPIRC